MIQPSSLNYESQTEECKHTDGFKSIRVPMGDDEPDYTIRYCISCGDEFDEDED